MKTINPLIQYKRLSIEKKSVIWYTLCNILEKGIAFITIPIITRMLTTDEYGVYSVFISWKDIFIIFTTLNLYCGVFTKVLVDRKDDQDAVTSSVQWLGSCISLFFLVLYLCFKNPINRLLGFGTETMLLLNAYYFFYPAFSLWCTKQRVNNKYIMMVVGTLIVSFFTPVVGIALITITNLRERGVIWGYLIVYIAAGVVFYIINTAKGRKIYDKELWMYCVSYNVPLIPHYLSMIALSQSDRLMIQYFEGNSKAGIYSLAYQVSSMMNIVFNAINSAFIPRAYGMLKDGAVKKLNAESVKLIYAAFSLSAFGIVIAPECVMILGGKAYGEAIYVIPAVCFAVFIRYVYGFFNNYEFYFAETKKIMIASTLAAIINIVLNWIFIPIAGYFAAGYTTIVGYGFLYLFHYRLSKNICREYYGVNGFSDKFVIGVLVITLVASAVLPVLYGLPVLRYLIIAGLIIIGIIKRNDIIKLIRK